MKKRDSFFIICIVYSLFLILFDFFKFDIMLKVEIFNFVAGIILGNIFLIPYLLFIILTIYSLVYAFKRVRTIRWKALLPTAVLAINIFLIGVFPYTSTYLNVNYSLNKPMLQKTINMINNKEIHNYVFNMNKYKAPFRLTSYSGVISTDVDNGVTKVMFYAYKGFKKDVVIVYSSNDSKIESSDFLQISNWNLSNMRKLDTNWYSANLDGFKKL